jgi:hypothetical protein
MGSVVYMLLFLKVAVHLIDTVMFSGVILCCVVNSYLCFGGACCLPLQDSSSPIRVAMLEKWVYYVDKGHKGSKPVGVVVLCSGQSNDGTGRHL